MSRVAEVDLHGYYPGDRQLQAQTCPTRTGFNCDLRTFNPINHSNHSMSLHKSYVFISPSPSKSLHMDGFQGA
jgi:hypothetical protein